ncbi:efflux RND transporter periplasmic adaptor subunit [Terriglobus saanensis]|uniref:Efflux transporter, RND family, MFP subunit n=1 Tax=Terriglobus saanensis (strain ATCC BAA-1853 / DSM 23119 / SP1PR4) TaxID=401053 RepID=E8V2A7_TERSS|nr:efflux RND transporter periplasmic adaptor subunit [Terriglobus saanensis]ADV81240.1 efflux transporter, RND family, MFP subunit [Terriglobus saanensis SP1PR4]
MHVFSHDSRPGVSANPEPHPICHATKVAIGFALLAALVAGCSKPAAAPPAAQAMPVKVIPVEFSAVPSSDTYVSTVKSRRSATMQPQIDGNITHIFVVSGQKVKAGQVLMQIDPLKQVAAVQSQQGLEQQQKAVYQYNQTEVERQRKLFEAGVTSRQVYDQAVQSFQNSKGAFDSSAASTNTQRQQLAYYQIRAPFAGIVGDVPVHLGDYVSPTTVLTTVDENKDLEAYIYLPTEQGSKVRPGLAVDVLDTVGAVLTHSTISFVSPQVDNGLQSILAKAPISPQGNMIRNGQIVNARVTWSTSQAPTVSVLSVTRIGGQTFVYVATPKGSGFFAHQVAVNLGEPIGNDYPVLSGLKQGDRVIVSGIQFLQEGVPVQPMGPQPAGSKS